MDYLLVDGYNIINSWTGVFDTTKDSLEECRIKLLDILANYQGYKKICIIAVFDSHLVKKAREKREKYLGLEVVFTRENVTADIFIERFVHKYSSQHVIRVATSDYLEQTLVLSGGGIRVSSRELREEIMGTEKRIKQEMALKKVDSHSIMSRLDAVLLEKLEKMRRNKF